ncbi:MAG: hypothetical protein NVS3B20_19230 [Polyangiales bacterium]
MVAPTHISSAFGGGPAFRAEGTFGSFFASITGAPAPPIFVLAEGTLVLEALGAFATLEAGNAPARALDALGAMGALGALALDCAPWSPRSALGFGNPPLSCARAVPLTPSRAPSHGPASVSAARPTAAVAVVVKNRSKRSGRGMVFRA